MLMTPFKLAMFRIVVMLLGPFPAGSRLIRKLLMAKVSQDGKITYVAHADFLDVRSLNSAGRASACYDAGLIDER